MIKNAFLSRSAVVGPDAYNLLFLAGLWIVALGILHPFGDFPLNDDWVYALSVKSIVEQGRFQLADWSQALGFPQAYWGALFAKLLGFSFATLRASMWLLGLGGVFATYFLLREVRVSAGPAFVGAACCAVNPLYFSLSNTFMTDVPFYFFGTFTLFALTRWFRRGATIWLAIGIVSCYLGILTRQFGYALLGSFVLALFWKEHISVRRIAWALLALAVGIAINIGLLHWLQLQGRHASMNFSIQTVVASLPGVITSRLPRFLLYISVFLFPCAVLVMATRLRLLESVARKRAIIQFVVIFVLLAVFFLARKIYFPGWGNVVSPWGIGPLAQKDTLLLQLNVPVTPKYLWGIWGFITSLGIGGLALIAGIGLSVIRDDGGLAKIVARVWLLPRATIFLILSFSTFIFLVCALPVTYFDRYVLLGIPLVASLVLPNLLSSGIFVGRIAWITSLCIIIAFLTLSVVATRDFFDWSSAKWQALRDLKSQGVTAERVDGGYEFNGWNLYRSGGQVIDSGKSWWWVEDDEYLVTSGPVPGYHEISVYPYRRILLGQVGRVIILKRNGDY